MSTKHTQISLPDIFNDCQNMFLSNSPVFLSAFIFQKIVSIPTDSLLIVLLHLSRKLRYITISFS